MAVWRLNVDPRERGSALFDAVTLCPKFALTVCTLDVGDYSFEGRVVIERKSYADFVASLFDGRLFRRAARLARTNRAIVLVERYGREPAAVHSHAIIGAIVSLAVVWRLPVIETPDVAASVAALEALARQTDRAKAPPLRRYGFKPKRRESQQLHLLQALPGVGAALAPCLLEKFGSPARALTAPVDQLAEVPGIGRAKAIAIRALLGE